MMKKTMMAAMMTMMMLAAMMNSALAAVDFGFWRYETATPRTYSATTYNRTNEGRERETENKAEARARLNEADEGEVVFRMKDCRDCTDGVCAKCNGRGWYEEEGFLYSRKVECDKKCKRCDGEGQYLYPVVERR